MSEGHTPGPWHYGPDHDEGAFPGALRVFHAPTSQPVCWRVHTEADARLIAAAPELLAACKAVLSSPATAPSEEALLMVNAAIAKAERIQA